MRGGPGTADHVDILGNHELISDVLKIVTNPKEETAFTEPTDTNAFTTAVFQNSCVRDRIFSKIAEISAEIDANLNLGPADLNTCSV